MSMSAPRATTSERLRALVAGRSFHLILLTLILLVAFTLRALRCAEGLPYVHHWDEPQTASTALRIMQTGDFNPHFFRYGSVMIYLNLGVDVAHYLYLMTKPDSDPESLSNLSEIKTSVDTGYHWTISHPSFYLWNRLLTALLGTGSVLIVYFLTRELAGRWAGILAAALLAGIDYEIANAAMVTPNVPMAFFGALGVLLAVLYLRLGNAPLVIGSAAACGLAASTKYNAAISIVAPMLALAVVSWRGRALSCRWLWAGVVLVPVLVFLAGTPYALLDLRHFLQDVGYEIRHYQVLGHSGWTIEPGLKHALYQMRTMAREIGVLPSTLALLGAGMSLAATQGRLAFAYPIVFFVFMSGTRISAHRNFLVLYPFAAVAFGCGVAAVGRLLETVRPASVASRLGRAALLVLAAVICFGWSAHALAVSWRLATTPETRSLTIDKVNEMAANLGGAPVVGIAQELRIHRLDLARLQLRHEEIPFFDLMCSGRSYDLVVTAEEIRGSEAAEQESAAFMNLMTRVWMSGATALGGARGLSLTNVNENPRILIVSRASQAGESPRCSGPLELRPKAGEADASTTRIGTAVDLGKVTAADTDWLTVAPGPHAFTWLARGASRSRFWPAMECTLKMRFGGIVAESRRMTVYPPSTETPFALVFEAPEGAEVSLTFERLDEEPAVRSVRFVEPPREVSAGAGARPPDGG